jgi:4-diphosphocytidyl-2-C-methyl-D-erythritol kinase
LIELAATLGADVPFFVGGQNALVEGIGEILTPAPLRPHWFAVLKPPAAVATAEIFKHPLVKRDTPAAIVAGLLAAMHENADQALTRDTANSEKPSDWSIHWGHNDLQSAAEALCSDVKKAVEILQNEFGCARMSGSGSAVFASAGANFQPIKTLQNSFLQSGWVKKMCCSLTSHPLANWAV